MVITLMIFFLNTQYIKGKDMGQYTSEGSCMLAGQRLTKEYARQHIPIEYSCVYDHQQEKRQEN